jgi:limonene-1,2-epoxide hydrolase
MWQALSDRNWEKIKTFLSDDCLYADMPLGPAFSAKGPDGIVSRLRLGLAPLESYENHPGLLVSNGQDAMYEHSETWKWKTGESVLLKFVSVHRVVDDKITLWKDYSDWGVLRDNAPPNWYEDLQNGDLSWVYDATGEL